MTQDFINRVVPQNEAERLKALERYGIAGTPPEASFNNIARIMAEVFDMPIALVSIVDRHEVFFKGNAGMTGVQSTPRTVSLCSYAILSGEPTVFERPLEEPCLLDNPLVHGEFGLRFYAAAPLTTPDGYQIGAVALVDKKERTFTPAQQDLLKRFATQVMYEIELRQAVSRQQEAEAQLQAANEEMRFITDSMPQMVWATEANGFAYFFNRGWIDYTGLPLESLQGEGWLRTIHPDDRQQTEAAWSRSVETGSAYEVEYRVQCFDGNYRWFLVRGTAMRDEQGRIFKWYGTTTDIHDQKIAEEALRLSNERFDLVAKATQDAIWDWDLQTDLIWWSEGFQVLFGYLPEEIEPTVASWYSRVHPLDREWVVKDVHEVIAGGGKNWAAEYRFRRRDGRYSIVLDRGYVLHDEQGRAYRMIGSMQDITDRKEAEETLRSSQEQQMFLLHLSDRIRKIADPAQIQYEAARALGERLGASRVGYAEDRGDGQTVLVTPNYTQGVTPIEGIFRYRDFGAHLFDQLQQGRLVIHTDIAEDGSLSAAEQEAHRALGVAALIDLPLVRDGRLIALLFVHFDEPHACTAEELMLLEEVAERTWSAVERTRAEKELERKVAERTSELEKLNAELRRTNNNLEEFAYAASHDLKEPIRKIHFFSDRLRSELTGRLDAAQTRLFERLELASRRMGSLIDDLLAYSQASRPVPLEESVNLNELVQQVLVDLELEIQQKGAQVRVDPLPVIRGHQRQMQQLFHNLLSNALKYARPDGAPRVELTHTIIRGEEAADHLSAEEQNDHFHRLEVLDNGIGFRQEDAERIFNVFTRLHGNAEYRGTGVGLSIVRKVVSNHGGTIWAEGRPGEGARFCILLPVQAG